MNRYQALGRSEFPRNAYTDSLLLGFDIPSLLGSGRTRNYIHSFIPRQTRDHHERDRGNNRDKARYCPDHCYEFPARICRTKE